jgi:hypothetical protein
MRKIYLVGTNVDELGIQDASSYYYYTMTEDPDGVYSGFMPVGVEGMCFTSYDWDWEYTDGRSESFAYDGTHNAFRVIGKNAEGKVALHQFDYPCAHTYTGGTGVCDLCLEPCAHGSWDANYSCTTCGYAEVVFGQNLQQVVNPVAGDEYYLVVNVEGSIRSFITVLRVSDESPFHYYVRNSQYCYCKRSAGSRQG